MLPLSTHKHWSKLSVLCESSRWLEQIFWLCVGRADWLVLFLFLQTLMSAYKTLMVALKAALIQSVATCAPVTVATL